MDLLLIYEQIKKDFLRVKFKGEANIFLSSPF